MYKPHCINLLLRICSTYSTQRPIQVHWYGVLEGGPEQRELCRETTYGVRCRADLFHSENT